MNLPKKYLTDFKYCYRLGRTEKGTKYSEIIDGMCQIVSDYSQKQKDYYGDFRNFSGKILVKENDSTKYIDKFTKIWLFTEPLSNEDASEVKISYIHNADGIIAISCQQEELSHRDIWYELDGEILSIEVIFDEDNLFALVPKNMYFPIDESTKVWYNEPDDSEPVRLSDVEEYKNYRKYNFR